MFNLLSILRTRCFLAGVIDAQSQEITELREKLGHKDRELMRTQSDYRLSRSFYDQIVSNQRETIASLEDENAELRSNIDDLTAQNDRFLRQYDLDPETEQDYIDQCVQDQADRAEADCELNHDINHDHFNTLF